MTSVEFLIDWLKKNHPQVELGPEQQNHFLMLEKIEWQNQYNLGFTKAKDIYLDAE